jgi:hypothetical protein
MPADDEKSPLILEFEEFHHKLHAAIRVTYFAFQEESKKILDVAFFPYAYLGQTSKRPANTDEIMWVKDAEDPQRWKPIEGRKITQRSSPKSKAQAAARAEARVENKRLMISSGLYYYLDVLLERMIPHVRQNFRDVAALARRYSSSDQLVLEAHLAPIEITACLTKNPDSLGFLCEFWGHPEYAAAFKERFRVVFVKEFERLRSEAELQGPGLTIVQTQDGRGEAALARGRMNPAGDLDTDESAEERWRRTQQIGDRVVSRKSPQQSAIGNFPDDAIMRPPEFESESEIVSPSAPAASQLEAAATPDPPADAPTPTIHESRIADADEQQTGAEEPWQIPLGKEVDEYFAELQHIQKLYPAGTTESKLQTEQTGNFEIVEKMKVWSPSNRQKFFARFHQMKAPELFDYIALLYNREGSTVAGWRKWYRRSDRRH